MVLTFSLAQTYTVASFQMPKKTLKRKTCGINWLVNEVENSSVVCISSNFGWCDFWHGNEKKLSFGETMFSLIFK